MEAIGYLLLPEVGLDFISNLAFGVHYSIFDKKNIFGHSNEKEAKLFKSVVFRLDPVSG